MITTQSVDFLTRTQFKNALQKIHFQNGDIELDFFFDLVDLKKD